MRQVHGPARNAMEWSYTSFDPPEKWVKADDRLGRYRDVTFPSGLESWSAADFDAGKAGWKRGLAPFGAANGEKRHPSAGKMTHGCDQSFCGCGEAINTLWEKEVLIMRAKLKLPKFKEGHIYRLCVGGMSHVQGGDGFDIYVNGKPFLSRSSGVGKRAGGRAVGVQLTKDKWAEFDGEVTIAARGFCPIPGGKRSPGVRRQHFSVFLQEMKAPPITEEIIKKGEAIHAAKAAEKPE